MGIVNLLIKNGANINAENYARETPLHKAASKGNCFISKNKNIFFEICLNFLSGDLDIVNLLIEKGANFHAQNLEKKTPLEILDEAKKQQKRQNEGKTRGPK